MELSFRYLVKVAEPRFKLPHGTHFTDKIITVEKQLAETKHYVVTTDFPHQQHAYISLIVHFVDVDFNFSHRRSQC